ncbi:uncharacterized protein LOC112568828 isoform X2 [Pomacea canaliculata]|uniref:uncharacterized protein LOC112568828 isoform X2 n=1 Tax=Pomacea canaliculata TaxID=400727 RepID=UPI000D728CA7|nr:uncharacterized protein LOC112568828 isoform X2 [Pomacea canaliculata]
MAVWRLWRLWILCGVALLAIEDGSGLIIGGCEQGSVDVVEESDPSFSCDALRTRLQWTVYNDKMETIFSGVCFRLRCSFWNKFYLPVDLKYFANEYGRSTLTMKGITRNSARTLSCNDSLTYARCDLRIIAKPVYRDCSVSISNWMVTGSCTVTGMYSSDNNYTCKWREDKKEEFGGFQTSLTSYINNSRTYTKGVCSFAKPMPLTRGNYTYSVSVSPGADDYFNKQIYIDKPYGVQINHNCPEYVFEGSDVSCTCYASRTVSPPALLVWEGRNNATLLLINVNRRLDQQQFTCRLEWTPDGSTKQNTSYILKVAYGPLDAVITTSEMKTEYETETITLTCTATDVYPSAVFQWNVTCYNRTDYRDSSTCSFNFTEKIKSLAILCKASNTYYHQANVSRVYILSSLGRPQANTGRPNAGLIGGIIAAVLLVLIVVAVLIVFIIKRRKDPVYDTTRKPDENEHSYEGLPLSRPKLLPTAGAGDETATSPDSDEHHYEEMTMTGQNAPQHTDSIYVLRCRRLFPAMTSSHN